MNEIEKLYANCNIQKAKCGYCSWNSFCPYDDIECGNDCPYWKYEDEAKYPQFTVEKQIKLLEFNYKYSRVPDIGYIIELKKYDCPHYDNYGAFDTFQEALCADINYHWEYFTEEEKEKVKGILNANI